MSFPAKEEGDCWHVEPAGPNNCCFLSIAHSRDSEKQNI